MNIYHSFVRITFYSILLTLFPFTLSAMEVVRIQKENEPERELQGRVVLKSSEGEQLFQTQDGQIHRISPQNVKSRTTNDSPFVPWTQQEISEKLLKEFGPSFRIHTVGPYLIVHNTSEEYAKWVGEHFNRLLIRYQIVWKKFGLSLVEPEFPLIAIVFSSKTEFDAYGKQDTGNVIALEMSAYYHKMTNRIVLCDLSGIEQQRKTTATSRSARTDRIVKRPGSGLNVSAITHEAAHQIGFNNGMFSRIAPIPLWLLEGVAMLHEPADISNPGRSESGEPKTNKKRLVDLHSAIQRNRSTDPIEQLLVSDDLLRSAAGKDYYAFAWGLTYYLYKQHKKDFSLYLQKMEKKSPYSDDSPQLRIEEFESCFDDNWPKFYKGFSKFVRGLK